MRRPGSSSAGHRDGGRPLSEGEELTFELRGPFPEGPKRGLALGPASGSWVLGGGLQLAVDFEDVIKHLRAPSPHLREK